MKEFKKGQRVKLSVYAVQKGIRQKKGRGTIGDKPSQVGTIIRDQKRDTVQVLFDQNKGPMDMSEVFLDAE